jgi:hypothetical protein
MPTDNTWLAATVNEVTSEELVLMSGETVQVSTRGLAARESIAVEIYQGNGFYQLMMGVAVELTARTNTAILSGPGQFRFNKPVTAAAVGLYIDR